MIWWAISTAWCYPVDFLTATISVAAPWRVFHRSCVASSSSLGKAAWWLPRWLDKALPDVDIEGEQLRKHLDAADGETGEAAPPSGRELQESRA